MQSEALTVSQYLTELPDDRRQALEELVEIVKANIKPGFDETIRWGMISYEIPLELSGPTYNSQPLNYVGIASQKNHISVYLTGAYMTPEIKAEFKKRWAASGLKLDMGKACVRFKDLSKADLETIAWAVGLWTPRDFLTRYQALRPTQVG